jgi:hypothetical protein
MREIAREHRKAQREELRSLRDALRQARQKRRSALREAKQACRTGRVLARQRAKELRARLLAEMRQAVQGERQAARDACKADLEAARALKSHVEQARAKLTAEQRFRREMRRIERANTERRRELAPKRMHRERMTESDDEVRANSPPELVGLFERVKRSIRGGERQSRTEAFLHYAEEHPGEVLAAIEDRSEELIAELEAREHEAARALRRPIPRAVLEEGVPF